jgi:hypothetical protein
LPSLGVRRKLSHLNLLLWNPRTKIDARLSFSLVWMPWKLSQDYKYGWFSSEDLTRLILLFNGKLVLLFQTYNIILYVRWQCVGITKIRLMMPRVKMSRADCNPWLAKMSRVDCNPWLAKMSRADCNPWLAKMSRADCNPWLAKIWYLHFYFNQFTTF